MRRIDNNKSSKKKQATKELISKLYFSRTQEGYLKKYGNDTSYIQQLGELMAKICKKKQAKILEEVKQNNQVFKKYLEKKHIVKLKIEDVVQFQGTLELEARKSIQLLLSMKGENNLKNLNNDIIRIGFMMVLQKLADQKLNGFISQSKYLKQILQRQNNNLKRLGFDYVGVEHPQKVTNIVQEIKGEEKASGSFKLINGKIRQQTATMHDVSNYLKSIIVQ